jgi:LL-diaminopimelate aminotransferase
MVFVNEHYLKLAAGYLFPEIARRVAEYEASTPAAAERIIRCGIGDVTEPIVPAVIDAMHAAIDELAGRDTFRGYPPPTGYDFLRKAIADHDYRARGIEIDDDEIFVSDGSKGDCGSLLEILGGGNRVAVSDPVYPVYVDTNVMAGNTRDALDGGGYDGLVTMEAREENGFIPRPPAEPVDLVYLCFPNNPTGSTIDREGLREWVEWAREHDALIVYDAAYVNFIRNPELPHSIFEIEGADRCAIETRSFSKNGGFTGVRCGYTVVPKTLEGRTRDGRRVPLHGLWNRRWCTRSNGVSWPVQCGAHALYSPEGLEQTSMLVDHYMTNASLLRGGCESMGLRVFGGTDAPYVWVRCPDGIDSWGMFDRLLHEAQIVTTPGAGFGRCGEGYFRISAFNSRANVDEVVNRMRAMV